MRRILLTRPRQRSEALAAALRSEGWTPLIWPLLEIEQTPPAPDALADAGALIFTSVAGVDALSTLGPLPKPAYVVGPTTAKAAEALGCSPVVTADGDGEALIRQILETGIAEPALHLRGADIRVEIAARLREAGLRAEELIVYRARPAINPPSDVAAQFTGAGFDAAVFYSPRTAEVFADAITPKWKRGLSKTCAIAISTAAASPLAELGFAQIVIADRPNGDAMRAAICGAAK